MRSFESRKMREAIAFAAGGGQALHLHTIVFPNSPKCFRDAVARGESIGHLFDQDEERLVNTARRFGVRRIVVEKRGLPTQHVDLCGAPMRAAIMESDMGHHPPEVWCRCQ